MPRPEDWKGSDMRSRAEVVQWLHDHGTDVHDETGLMVGRMRQELGKGRALSQLLLEMEQDGMIEREVRGRRTFRINLVDDWGLRGKADAIGYRRTPEKTNRQRGQPETEAVDTIDLSGADVDLEALAETLLAVVLKRAQVQPSKGAENERLREDNTKLKGEVRDLKDALVLARESEQEQRRQAEAMRKSLVDLQKAIDRKPRRNETPLVERLSGSERKLLDDLMKTAPTRRG